MSVAQFVDLNGPGEMVIHGREVEGEGKTIFFCARADFELAIIIVVVGQRKYNISRIKLKYILKLVTKVYGKVSRSNRCCFK